MGRKLLRAIPLIVLGFALTLAAGCAGSSEFATDQEPGGIVKPPPVEHSAADSLTTDRCSLVVGDINLVGTCEIYNEGGYLYFDFAADPTWKLTGVKVYAGSEPPDGEVEYRTGFETEVIAAPATSAPELLADDVVTGTASPGDPAVLPSGIALPLPYERADGPPVSSLELAFSLSGISGATLHVMASATMERGIEVREAVVRSTVAPGEDVFEYSMAPEMQLPSGELLAYLSYGTGSTYRTTFYNCPAGYDIAPNTPYAGWCVDLAHVINPNQMYTMSVYSTLDPELPDRLVDDDWDKVNYILNHKQGSRSAVQSAIWYFVGGGAYPQLDDAVDMVEAALLNGEGFAPKPDEVLAVALYTPEPLQETIFEVEVEEPVLHE